MNTMKKIIAFTGLVMGVAVTNTVFASSNSQPFNSESLERVQQYQTMVSTNTMLNYGNILLQRSSVAQKLKLSNNPADNTRYHQALEIYKQAEQAYQSGDEIKAKQLALDAIRMIARAVPQYYSQTAKAD